MAVERSRGNLTPQPHTELKAPGVTSLNAARLISGAVTAGIVAFGAWRLFGAGFLVVLLALAALVFTVVGIRFFVQGRREERAWNEFEFHFPEWGLPLGSVSTVTVVRQSKLPIPNASPLRLSACLRCNETVRYQQGTKTRTDHYLVVEEHLEIVGSIESNTFTGALVLPIPADGGGPTLDLRHNDITWTLAVEPAPISTLTKALTLDLPVLPVLARHHRRMVDGPPPPTPPHA